jgi:ligand-binding sensor domain-containing protein
MKYVHGYTLFLMFVCHTSYGQNQTNVPKDNISKGLYSESQLKEMTTSNVPTSMVRNIKQARNGDILIASYLGVFRYDGTSFTNLTSKMISPRFSSFWDVLEDRKGNLWFGTKDSGVYCYNGKSFQHFTTKDGLASNQVFHIYQDKTGNMWFGASRYDGKSFRNFTTKDGLPHNSIRPIPEDKTGKFWFGTRDNSLVYDGKTFTTKDGFPINSVSLVLEDKTGKSWFASGGNIYIYDGKTFTTLTNKDGKAFKNVRCIIEDKKGNILFSDVDGLWRYDGSTFTNFSQRGAYAIIEDKKGNIWTTTGGGTLFRYDGKTLYSKNPTVTEIQSQSVMLLGILEDAKGNIWFGSGGGVYRYDGKTITDFKSAAGQQ